MMHGNSNIKFTVNTFTNFVTDIFHVYIQTILINLDHDSRSSYKFNDNRSTLSINNVRTNIYNSQIIRYVTMYQLAYTCRSVDGRPRFEYPCPRIILTF